MLMEWILSASALTAAVLILRLLVRRRVSQKLMYALWLPVLLRLVLPISLYRAPVSVPAAAERLAPAMFAAPAPVYEEVPKATASPVDNTDPTPTVTNAPAVPATPAATHAPAAAAVPLPDPEPVPAASPPDWGRLLSLLWLAGGVALGLWLLGVNLAFRLRLNRDRTLFREGRTPVYVTEAVASPCLFGLFRPAVYLTPRAAALEPERLDQVLLHEYTHRKQLDHIWNLLRCLTLAVWWWNPLVWAAAICSRRDSELSCDEGVLRQLGAGARLDYGHTLLDLAPKKAVGTLLCAATVSGGGRALRERLERIVKRPKVWAIAAVIAVALTALALGCSLGGRGREEPAPSPGPEVTALLAEEGQDWLTLPEGGRWLTQAELSDWSVWLNADWMRGQFLTSTYARPEDVNLHELFYMGVDLGETDYPDTDSLNPVTSEDLRNYLFRLGWIDPEKTLEKLPRKQVDALLRKYLGMGLEDTALVGFDFSYVPETDCFYRLRGPAETNRRFPQLLYGYVLGDTVVLYHAPDAYEQEHRGVEAEVSRLRLRIVERETYFLTNQAVLRRGEDYVYETPEVQSGSLDLSGDYGRDITVLYLRGTVSEEEKPSFKSVRGWGYPGSGTLNYGETKAKGEYGPDSCLWFQTQERLYRLPTPVYTLDGVTVDADLGAGDREEEYVLQTSGSYAPPLLRWSMDCSGEWDLGGRSGYRQDLRRRDGQACYTLDLETLEIFLYFRPEGAGPALAPATVPEPATPGDLSVTTVEGPETTPGNITDGTRSAVFTLDRDGYQEELHFTVTWKDGRAEPRQRYGWQTLLRVGDTNRFVVEHMVNLYLLDFDTGALEAFLPEEAEGVRWADIRAEEETFDNKSSWATAPVMSPEGSLLLYRTDRAPGGVRLYDFRSGEDRWLLRGDCSTDGAVFSKGWVLLRGGEKETILTAVKLETREARVLLGLPRYPITCSVTGEGDFLVACTNESTEETYTYVLDPETAPDWTEGYAADSAAAMAAQEGLRVSGTGPEEIAEAYNARRWESLETLPPDNRCGIRRYTLLRLEVKAGEEDGYFYAYALTAIQPNIWNSVYWWAGAGADLGSGEYSGWMLYGLYYRLERREGYWVCTETASESSPLFRLPPLPLTGAELSYRGVSIGDTAERMREILGEPEEVTEHLYASQDPPQGLEYREYRYGGACFREAYSEDVGWTGVIGQIEIWDTSAAPGPRGILLGESPESVMDLFPREYDYREDAYYRFYGELWHMGAGGCVNFTPEGEIDMLIFTVDAQEPGIRVYFEDEKAVRIFLGYNWI